MDHSDTSPRSDTPIGTNVIHPEFDLDSFVMDARLAKAWGTQGAQYPTHRELHFSARRELDEVFDDLALNLGWRGHRTNATSVLLDADGLFISGSGARKPDYCSCAFQIWAATPPQANGAKDAILARLGDTLIRDPMISVDWTFQSGKGELQTAHIEEIADDKLHDEAYPDIKGGVAAFIEHYLESPETVLVLQGPPGTGKTRLIRAVLGELSRRRGGCARALFTSDKRALENDEIYVKFLTGRRDAFVVEDADHLLQPRAKGNDHLHKFLTIADGIVRAQGRKIVFSTNLPNVGDLDDALVRPGRCFGRVLTRKLSWCEAMALMDSLSLPDQSHADSTPPLTEKPNASYALAELYKAHRVACALRCAPLGPTRVES